MEAGASIENNATLAWTLYEAGREYNNRISPERGGYYRETAVNQAMFDGDQWLNLPDTPAMRGILKPTFNIIKRVASLFIASLTSSAVTLRFEPLAYYGVPQWPSGGTAPGLSPGGGGSAGMGAGYAPEGRDRDVSVFANAEVANLLEKFKFDYRIRDALFDGARSGDYCAHFWFDPEALPYGGALGGTQGEIRMELVDGTNVIFGNPNDRNVENQPWILLVGRDTVSSLREEARRYRKNRTILRRDGAVQEESAADDSGIRSDTETQDFPGVGGQTELTGDEQSGGGKALYVLLYTKKERVTEEPGLDGIPVRRALSTVHVTKATRNAVIYEDVDTGLSVYPVAWGNWEKQKHQYHGRALVTGLVPNQIFINTMFAAAMRHLHLGAFPKIIYNADIIPAWSNEIGQAVAVHMGRNDPDSLKIPMSNISHTIPASDMSGQIFALIDKAMDYTRECLGATDAQMGNVRPDNTSALMVLQTNAEIPLENIRAGLHEWVEDIGRILLDMMGTYYGTRSVVVEREFQDPVMGLGRTPQIDPNTGTMVMERTTRKAVEMFDFSVLKCLWLSLRVDVGATTYFSEIAMTQTLDNLRRDGTLDVIQYLERVPEKLIPRKEELLQALKSGAAARGIQPETAGAPGAPSVPSGAAPVQAGPLDEAAAVQGLPNHMAAAYDRLGGIAKRTAQQLGEMRLAR